MTALPTLLFDLDGTLVDSARGIAAALSALSRARGGGEVPAEAVRPLVSQGVDVLVREALGAVAGDSANDVLEFRTILEGQPADAAAIYPGARAALEQLAAAGYRQAVVTNKPERLSRLLLEELALAPLFGAIVGGDTLPLRKPDPAPLLQALASCGAEGGPALMIGDSRVDAAAAAAAGVPFLLFEAGYDADGCASHPVAGQFSDYAQLAELVREVMGSVH